MPPSPKDFTLFPPRKWLIVLFPLLDSRSLWLCTRVVFFYLCKSIDTSWLRTGPRCVTVYLWNKECNLWCSSSTWCSADQHACEMWHANGRRWNWEVWLSLTGFAGGGVGRVREQWQHTGRSSVTAATRWLPESNVSASCLNRFLKNWTGNSCIPPPSCQTRFDVLIWCCKHSFPLVLSIFWSLPFWCQLSACY